MDRLEFIREKVDEQIKKIAQENLRKLAYIHTYGVAQMAVLLAKLRNEDAELACVAAMLHDISLYVENCPHSVHAEHSAKLAKSILEESNLFTCNEILTICTMITCHSNKLSRQDSPLSETLKDADVLQHYLYNTNIPPSEKDKVRLYYLLEKMNTLKK